MPPGGTFVATAQGSQNAGHGHEPEMKYLVTIKNRGASGKFTLYIGGLT
jgi:hypothetical protein